MADPTKLAAATRFIEVRDSIRVAISAPQTCVTSEVMDRRPGWRGCAHKPDNQRSTGFAHCAQARAGSSPKRHSSTESASTGGPECSLGTVTGCTRFRLLNPQFWTLQTMSATPKIKHREVGKLDRVPLPVEA